MSAHAKAPDSEPEGTKRKMVPPDYILGAHDGSAGPFKMTGDAPIPAIRQLNAFIRRCALPGQRARITAKLHFELDWLVVLPLLAVVLSC